MDTTPESKPIAEEPYSGDVFAVLDLETTGLEVEGGAILEIAWYTAPSLLKLAYAEYEDVKCFKIGTGGKGPMKFLLEPVAASMHAASGLLGDLIAEGGRVLSEIESQIIEDIRALTVSGRAILVGNSVHFDHAWIEKFMPRLNQVLHYRHVDLTSDWIIGEEVGIPKTPRRVGTPHRADDDVRTTLLQLRDALEVREQALIYREIRDTQGA